MVINEDLTVDVGIVKIHLPSAVSPSFLIAQSLGEEFGLETNYEAEEKLRVTLKGLNSDTYKKVNIDAEAGCIFISANSKQGNHILEVAIVINQLAIPPFRQELDPKHIEVVRNALTTWKRPKPQKWKEGDVFSIPLSDGSLGYGQVLWQQVKKSVTCALFGCRSKEFLPIEEIIQSTIISVITTRSGELDNHKWKVIKNAPLKIEKSMVPWEHSGDPGVGSKIYQESTLSSFLEAYFAIKPWNFLPAKDNFMDTLLLPGVSRPNNVVILTKEQKRLYIGL